MEQEIDNLFLSSESIEYTEKSIDDLENNIDRFTSVLPYVILIKDKISSIDTNFNLYHVKLDRLATEMKDIEEQNSKLENEIFFQTSIYETLKDLLLKLQIKEDYFLTLETESFTNEGIIKIEEALEKLENFKVEDFTIRVVVEKQTRINETLQNFYSKFVRYIRSLLKEEQSLTTFQTHNDLYEKLQRFKFLFKMVKNHTSFYSDLCNAYIKYSRVRYNTELSEYLKKLLNLNKESKKTENLEQTISTVLETYKYILKVESNFLNSLFLDIELNDIFADCNQKIIEFFKDLYFILSVETICFISKNVESEEFSGFYKSFIDDLSILLGKLKKKFLQKEVELRDKEKGIERFRSLIKISNMDDFNNLLFRINISRIIRLSDDASLWDILDSKRFLNELGLSYKYNEEYKEADNNLNIKLEKEVIDYVFENGSVLEQISNLEKKITGSVVFITNIKSQIYKILANNLDDKEKEEAQKILLM